MARRILAISIAALLAIVSTLAVLLYVRGADRRALAGQEAVAVFVARQPIAAGMTAKDALEAGLMQRELVARKAVPEGALTEVTPATEPLVATAAIQPGQVVLAPAFQNESEQEDSAVPIPSGKMAVTVELGDPQRVAPFLRAGNEVAIFTSYKHRRLPKKDEPKSEDECGPPEVCATRIVLTRVTVLGVGEATTKPVEQKDADDKAETGTPDQNEQRALITLALTQKEAEKVIHLSFFGNMHFALLSDDSQVEDTPGVSDLNFFAKK